MSDKLISQFDEGIPANADWLLYEDANSAGNYKKVKRANVGSGSGSVGVTLTTPTLSVSVASSSSINLSWTNVSGESSYQVQQSLNNTTWTTIATPGANSTALTVSGLSASTLYYFRVKAVGDGVSFLDSGYGTGSGTTASGAGDTTAPTISSRTVIASDKIRVVYNEAMGSPSAAGHQFIVDGTAFTPTSATSFNSNTVDYIVGTTMTSGSVVTHGYSLQPTGQGTRDLAGNQLAGFSGASVTNSLGGGSTWTKKAGVTMTTNVGGYWEYLPTSYTPSGTKIPVIIAWHGGGAQGTGSSADLNALLNEGVPQQINAEGFSYQSVVICPQYTGGAPSSAMIEAVIDYVLANYNVEPTKVHLTGLSFGGAILGNWAVTGTINKVASISVLCSYFDVNSTAVSRLKASGMPIRLYHGTADSIAPVANSRNWFNSLNATTSIVPATEKYEIVGAEHNIWTDVYPSSAIFGGKNWAQWHMEQQRVIPTSYLTWDTPLDSDLEVYNSSKGIRKKSTSSDAWADNIASSVETISNGEEVVFRIPVGGLPWIIGLASTKPQSSVFSNSNTKFGIYANQAFGSTYFTHENGVNNILSTGYSSNAWARIRYSGGSIIYGLSSDGVSWTTVDTSTISPSGSYYVFFEAYSANSGPDEIFKRAAV